MLENRELPFLATLVDNMRWDCFTGINIDKWNHFMANLKYHNDAHNLAYPGLFTDARLSPRYPRYVNNSCYAPILQSHAGYA